VVALTAGVKAMNTKSFFSVVLVALVASHGGWALADEGEICDQTGSVREPTPAGLSELRVDPFEIEAPGIQDCVDDNGEICDNGTNSLSPLTVDQSFKLTGHDEGAPSIAECLVQGNEPPPPPPPTPSSGDPELGPNSKSLDGQHYVEYTLDGDGGWTGYRATLDLAPDAAGTFASLDFRGTNGQVSEVRIALVTDASGARWAAATAVDRPELGVALVPVHDDQVSLTLRFGPGALGMTVDGQAASLALPPGTDVEVVRVGHFAVDTGTAPVLAITSPRFLRTAH
jgi:hypothetical protein